MEVQGQVGPKVGLALSGGGFRAAFFHIGVLAHLAELGILRKVEVISTVSGGSIIGALYYLRLKKLLESEPDGNRYNPDHAVLDAQYCALVEDVEARLRRAVARNMRARVASNLLKNLYMASPRYSRSTRMGDLYDRYLYKRAWEDKRERRWNGFGPEKRIELRELRINPLDATGEGQTGFHPKLGNESRENKVPTLLINATTLNSGHNWRFEAIRMGELDPEDAAIAGAVDKNMQLRQAYFDEADLVGREDACLAQGAPVRFPLARAVAASAGVPGIFHPITVGDLYDGISVQLVDGGVQDNQGLQGLLDHDCNRLIISDASHQMGDEDKPPTTLPAVAGRSSGIASDRIRDLQMIHLGTTDLSRATMDLRKGLDARVVKSIGCEPAVPDGAEPEPEPPEQLGFGVERSVQRSLADVRTDLDFFSDVEASSLELDGYLISKHVLGAQGPGFSEVSSPEPIDAEDCDWRFRREVGGLFERSPAPAELMAHLEAAKSKFFRPFQIPGALAVGFICFFLAVGLVAVGVIVDAGDWLGDVLPWNWPDGLNAVLGVTALITGATYLGSASRSSNVQKACSLISGLLLPLIVALPAFLWSGLQIVAQPLRWFGNHIPTLPPGPAVSSSAATPSPPTSPPDPPGYTPGSPP